MRPAKALVGLALALTFAAACGASPHRTRALSRLDAEYLRGGFTGADRPVAATTLYRGVMARSLGSRCKMYPTDSQLFDRRAAACGATAAAALGIARVLLEVAGDPQILPSLVAEGRLRWVDLPARGDCRP
jgi:hypothetical protein